MVAAKPNKFDPEVASLARYAKALAHPARIAILQTLAERNTCICGEIVEVLPLAQSTVSQHLKELKAANLIRGEIEGTSSCYCINPEAFKDLEKLLGPLLKKCSAKLNNKRCC